MCGLVGVVGSSQSIVYDAVVYLNGENNRGEQACGAAVDDGKRIRFHRGEGLVANVFGGRNSVVLSMLKGNACIMQALYSTIGRSGEKKQPKMIQPLVFSFHGKTGAVGHNGNLVRLSRLREQAKKNGYEFQSQSSDTELIPALLSIAPQKDFLSALVWVLRKLEGKGALSLVLLYDGKVIGVRDSNGVRPLCLGKRNGQDDSYILASESSVFPMLKSARFIREVEPGELVVLGPCGIERSMQWSRKAQHKLCICEMIYFSNPAARFFGRSVYAFRAESGKVAASEHPIKADVVVPIPDSGRGAADGFASKSGIPQLGGIVKSRYSSRTFMEPRETDRSQRQRAKLQALPDVMAGKRVCLVEDSIFRGSVAKPIVSLTRVHGCAREVHLVVCSPPARFPCHLGLDTSTSKELLASRMTVSEIQNFIHCDSLGYLSIKGLKEALRQLGLSPDNFCFGCFDGKYPVPPEKKQ